MRIAILDPTAGISGDMTLGALLSLGLPVSWLEELPRRLGVGDVRVTVRDVRRAGVTCKQIDFTIPEQPHGLAPEQVHLHEVGAVDAVLDIVGAIEGFERLGVGAVYNFPVAVGHGWVDAAHGKLPVPAPATAILLEGLEIAAGGGGPVEGETTTPTAPALLRVLSAGP